MPFDFPFAPTEGQIFNAPSGPTYVYNAPVWKAVGQGQIAITSDNAPANPANGTLWWESDTGILWIYYNDGNSSQWVQAGGLYAPVGTAETRNRIVNGGFQISQQFVGGSNVVSPNYVADQWTAAVSSSSVVTFVRQGPNAAPPSSAYPIYPLSISVTVPETSAAAGEYVQLLQYIEGIQLSDFRLGTAQSAAFILAFSAYIPIAGTYWVAFSNPGNTHTYLGSYTISASEVNTWVRKQINVPSGAINAGSWPQTNVLCMQLHFTFHAGSTFLGVAGFQTGGPLVGPGAVLGLSTTAACYLGNVGLYLDPNSTGVAPPWQMPDEAGELLTCMRYFQWTRRNTIQGYQLAGNNIVTPYTFPVPPRTTPAMTAMYYATGAGASGTYSAAPDALGYNFTALMGGAAGMYNVVYEYQANARM